MTYQILLSESIFQQGKADISRTEKDDSCCEPNLKTMKIECIHWELEAEQSVVDDSDSDSPGDPI